MRAHAPTSPRVIGSAIVVAVLVIALVAQAAWLFSAQDARAQTFEVHLKNFEFVVPADLPKENQCGATAIPCIEITQGDSIRFIWDEGTHSVTGDTPSLSDELAYDSGVQSAPFETTFVFEEDVIINVKSTVQADIDAGMVMRIVVREGEPTPRPTRTPAPTSSPTSIPSETPTSEPSETPSATPTSGAPVDLFEGWTPLNTWGGPDLEGDAITTYFNEHIVPDVWTAAARFDSGMWQQRFKNPPLPNFNTLNELENGQAIWFFATADGVLTY